MVKLILMLVVTGVISQKIPELNPPNQPAGWDVTLERKPTTYEWIENRAFELGERNGMIFFINWLKIPGYGFNKRQK